MSIGNQTSNIDVELAKQGLHRLQNFKYNVGDCLFDTLEFLLNFTISSTQLRCGTIDYFSMCFERGHLEAIHAYNHELHPTIIKDLHNVNEKTT